MLRSLCCLSLLFCFSVSAQESATENLFQKGLAAYQNKQFGEARDHFQKLIESNVVSAPLLHNLALSYFQLDQAPMSLALWRKALSIEPSFRPARAGREFAELKLQVRGYERDPFSASVRGVLEYVSLHETLWLMALVMGLAGWLWIRYWADRRHALDEEAPLPPFPVVAIILSGIFLATIGLSILKWQSGSKARATVVANKVSARSLPSSDGVGLFELKGGAEVLIRRRDKEWSQIQNGDGASGWVANNEIFVTSGG